MKPVRIGTRESKLAVIQSEMVGAYLREHGIKYELVPMKTTGDKILNKTLDKIGGKGLFVKELDQALLDGRSDISVHSLKDLPMEVPEELPVLAYSGREDPRDVLVLPEGETEIDFSRPIGSSSFRRRIQIEKLYPQARVESVRGNVQTRLRKLDEGQYGALILAAAGLIRLGLEDRISRYFEPEEILPAAGQGVLAVQGIQNGDYSWAEDYNDIKTEREVLAERAFVRWLDGGCSSPIAAFARCGEDELTVEGLYYDEATGAWHRESMSGDPEHPEELGIELARTMKGRYE
ncbi:MAG: hydroxymethylbilane synthase [Firmicutes bacterium]|nr:hydroxymethylbilane synthase [Bacillota bacterium]